MVSLVGTSQLKQQSPPLRDEETALIEFLSALLGDVGLNYLYACLQWEGSVEPTVLFFPHRMVRPRLTIYVCQESLQLREQQQPPQQKQEDGDSNGTFFGRLF